MSKTTRKERLVNRIRADQHGIKFKLYGPRRTYRLLKRLGRCKRRLAELEKQGG